MKLWFDLGWVRKIGQTYPALARFVEMFVHAVVTAALFQIAKVFLALNTALQNHTAIDFRDILLQFDWQAVVSVGVVMIMAAVNKKVMETRRAEDKVEKMASPVPPSSTL